MHIWARYVHRLAALSSLCRIDFPNFLAHAQATFLRQPLAPGSLTAHIWRMPKTRFKDTGAAAASAGEDSHCCDHPSCDDDGLYRAPRSRDELDTYYLFCLGHVREYNKAWNYYAGMTEEEIEAHVRADVVGWRPTWPVGCWLNRTRTSDPYAAQDSFGFFKGKEDRRSRNKSRDAGHRRKHPRSVEAKAMSAMDLKPPLALKELKSRYKQLAKRFHPDTNGGDKSAEEKLKLINQAYATLRKITSY